MVPVVVQTVIHNTLEDIEIKNTGIQKRTMESHLSVNDLDRAIRQGKNRNMWAMALAGRRYCRTRWVNNMKREDQHSKHDTNTIFCLPVLLRLRKCIKYFCIVQESEVTFPTTVQDFQVLCPFWTDFQGPEGRFQTKELSSTFRLKTWCSILATASIICSNSRSMKTTITRL